MLGGSSLVDNIVDKTGAKGTGAQQLAIVCSNIGLTMLASRPPSCQHHSLSPSSCCCMLLTLCAVCLPATIQTPQASGRCSRPLNCPLPPPPSQPLTHLHSTCQVANNMLHSPKIVCACPATLLSCRQVDGAAGSRAVRRRAHHHSLPGRPLHVSPQGPARVSLQGFWRSGAQGACCCCWR